MQGNEGLAGQESENSDPNIGRQSVCKQLPP